MEYQIIVTARMKSLLEWMVRCSRILNNRQMFSIILRSGDWDGQSRQSTSLLSFHNFVCTDWFTGVWFTGLLQSWKIHWLFSNWERLAKDYCQGCLCTWPRYYFLLHRWLYQLPRYKYTPKTIQPHGLRHCNLHTVLNIVCSTFPRIFATHTHVDFLN